MTLQIEIREETAAKLQAMADALELSLEEYLERIAALFPALPINGAAKVQRGSTTHDLAKDLIGSLDRSGYDPASDAHPRRPDPRPAMEWLRLHGKEYGGQWVALDGDRLIAHGPDAMDVYAAAKADGAYLPLIDYIEPADALPFIF